MPNSNFLKKRELRKIINNRHIKNIQENSSIIFSKVISSQEYIKAKTIFVYISLEKEVCTKQIIEHALKNNKIVLVPVIKNGFMETHIIDKDSNFIVGQFDILTPENGIRTNLTPDLTLVPMLGYFMQQRLGKGGGYYDKYLAKHPNTYKMGLCFLDNQIDFPFAESHDVYMDEVITN